MAAHLTSTLSLDLPAVETPAAAPPPGVSGSAEDAVRLALRLRDCRAAAGGRVLMFVPATAAERVEPLVSGITKALEQLQEGPVLVLDLERPASAQHPPSEPWPVALPYHGAGGALDAPLPRVPVAFAQPIASPEAAVTFLSSPEFAAVIASARSHYCYVLCMAGAVSGSVEGLVAAAQCDGVVLAVTAGRTTMREVQAAQRQLARVRANVLGFVVQQEQRRS